MTTKKTEDELQKDHFKTLYFLVQYDSTRFKEAVTKSDLDQGKKKLLWGLYYYRKKQKTKVFEFLNIAPLQDSFYEGVRLYLLGLAHNHFGKHAFSNEHLEKAFDRLKATNDPHFCIYTISTILLNLSNQQKVSEMPTWIDELKSYPAPNDYCQLLMYQVEAIYLSMNEECRKSENVIAKAMKIDGKEALLFKPSFLILNFRNAFNRQKFDQCYMILQEYKKLSGFYVPANYSYMKILLDNIVHEAPIYVYPQEYQDSQELLDQLMLVKFLSSNDIEDAKKVWRKLAKHNPSIYKDDFEFVGPSSIFKSAIEKHRPRNSCHSITSKSLERFPSSIEKLHYIVKSGKNILTKSELITLIFNEEVSESSLIRLRKLIYDYKKKYGVELKTYQGSYRVLSSA